MTIDELIRVVGYTILAPSLGYLGMVAFNRRQYTWASFALLLSVFFFLLLLGLVNLRLGQPQPHLLQINTGVVVALTMVVLRQTLHYLRLWWVEWRTEREHKRISEFTLMER